MLTPLPCPHQYSLNLYFVIFVSEIDFVVPEVFELYGRNKVRVAITKYLEFVIACDGEVNKELRSLVTCLAPSTSQWKKVTRILNDHSTYKGYQDYIEDETLKRAIRCYLP